MLPLSSSSLIVFFIRSLYLARAKNEDAEEKKVVLRLTSISVVFVLFNEE
jgi:hypothetical protein